VNLRVMEKEDLPLYSEWNNDTKLFGEFGTTFQMSRAEVEKSFESSIFETKAFIIQKKDGTKIGYILQFNMLTPYAKLQEIGYAIIPSERGKGYCTEATQLMVDYLFLSKGIARIQATTHPKNVASQKVLEKVGFKREGTFRKPVLFRGEWIDGFMFSILREEWKEPKILTNPTQK